MVKYYHEHSAHAEGMDQVLATVSHHFYHPDLRRKISNQVASCVTCQHYKCHGGHFGELAPREALAIPWQEIHVDTIGPWRVKHRGIKLKFKALTVIDPVTNLLEIH